MNKLYIEERINYTGAELYPHWIYRRFNLCSDVIIAFCGETKVELDSLVDIEDVINDEPIYSKNMLNFLVEHFEIGLTEAVLRQRMLICIIKETLEDYNKVIIRRGDDLFYEDRKLTVSIATKSLTSCLIHTGINICADGAPIEVSSLEQMGISDIKEFANKIMQRYTEEMMDIKIAVAKVRGVGGVS